LTLLPDLDTAAQALFQELNRLTEGDPAVQASMYTMGETIGLERDASARAAEDLIAAGLVEIRTLSGGIGLSEEGANLLGETDEGRASNRLGTTSPLSPPQYELVDQTLTRLKTDLGERGLPFETLSEMIADIRSIEAQLASPKAKTPIIRACFNSLRDAARESRQAEWQRILEDLLE
jgi:hypothetical protein